MTKLLGAYLFPHPPIIVEEIGKGQEKEAEKTIIGVKSLAKDIGIKKPTTIILITPHGPVFSDAIAVSCEKKLEGSFKDFGRGDLKFKFTNNIELVNKIIRNAGKAGIAVAAVNKEFALNYRIKTEVDHGALVPLSFVNKKHENYKLVHITYGLIPQSDLYKFGTIIQDAVLDSEEEIVFIASGDLSHRLSNEGPYSYSPDGKVFDQKIVKYLKNKDFESIASFDTSLGERAGECGLRSLIIMTGFLDGLNVDTKVYSYEGPFGVGYCTAKIDIKGRDSSKEIYNDLIEKKENKLKDIRKRENEYVSLARKSLEYYIKNKKEMKIPDNIGKELISEKAGVFVSIKKDGKLRGCIGTIEAVHSSIAEEIIKNTISAGTRDPRFPMVSKNELGSLVYSVDVLKEAEKIDSIDELDVERYGIIVSKGFKKGLLLPNLEGINTPKEQIQIALEKANIREDEDYIIERFEVERHI